MRHWKKWTVLAVSLSFVAAACGDDDEEEGTDTTAAAVTVAPTTAAPTETTAAEPEETTAETEPEATEPPDSEPEATEPPDSEPEATEPPDSEPTESIDPASIEFDVGVTEDVIRIGLNADLSGAFAPLVTQIVDGQEAYWEIVNDNGGIAGREVELVILDNAYDIPKHLENYEVMSGEGDQGVVMFSQSTGSPHTSATADSLVEDDLIAIPLSWYSGWADPAIGQNVFEAYTSYCIESMNAVEYLAGETDAQTIAIATFPGEYGQDGAFGAKYAAEQLGLEVVYDGEGLVVPGADQTSVIQGIVDADPDLVWLTTNPPTMAEILGSAYGQGLTDAVWSGNSPTYNFQLLATDLAPVLDEVWRHSTYTQLWNSADVPGMTEVVEGMREKRPDAPVSDVYIVAWTEGYITQQILEQAARNGDMTRAGVVAAANEVTAELKGLAPDQTWAGEPNDFIVRESYIYDVDASKFTPEGTVSDEDAGTGFTLLEGPFVGEVAADYDFQGACFTPAG